MKKDFSKLRNVDPENLQLGDIFIGRVTEVEHTVIGTLNKDRCIAAVTKDGIYSILSDIQLKAHFSIPPIFWLDGSPVYIGDYLYYSQKQFRPVRVTGKHPVERYVHSGCSFVMADDPTDLQNRHTTRELLSLEPPVIDMEGWINVYSIESHFKHDFEAITSHVFKTEELAKANAADTQSSYLGTFPFKWKARKTP